MTNGIDVAPAVSAEEMRERGGRIAIVLQAFKENLHE